MYFVDKNLRYIFEENHFKFNSKDLQKYLPIKITHVLLQFVTIEFCSNSNKLLLPAEKHGIHQQKDLNKFYSNLLKNNISMGAYNARASGNEGSSKEHTTRTEPPKDKDKDTKKEMKKNDDNNKMVEKKRQLDEEDYLDEQIVKENGNDERTEEMIITTHKRTMDDKNMEDKTTDSIVQEKTKKKAEKRNTEETVMAARERYLARKRMKQET